MHCSSHRPTTPCLYPRPPFHSCASTGKAIPKDKAVTRFIVRNIVDASSMRDIRDASAYEAYALPKVRHDHPFSSPLPSNLSPTFSPALAPYTQLYIKQYYCIEAAVHQRIVRSRSAENRRNREPPARFQRR